MSKVSRLFVTFGLVGTLAGGIAYFKPVPAAWVPDWVPAGVTAAISRAPAQADAIQSAEAPAGERSEGRRGRRRAEGGSEGSGGSGGSGAGSGRRGRRGDGEGPVPVVVADVARKDVPVLLEGVGTARPLKTVTVRPQVDGTILKIAFEEGQQIAEGDLLAEIDSATYRAQRDQAVAKRTLTEKQLENARLDLARYQKIPGVVAEKTVDTQRAQVAQLEAQIKADVAAIAQAETVLGYTRITSPISGRVGMRLVDEGNLVRAGDAGLAVITQIQPISVLFTLPQQQLAEVNRALAAGAVKVEALGTDGKSVVDTGVLKVVDNQIDQQTGTVRMKADFPNATRQLWPGQFANVRVRVDTLKDAVAIPLAAVQRGPSGTFVYVVDAERRATMRPVTLGLLTDTDAVVTAGLDAGARVVTTGFGRLSDGAKVRFGDAPKPDAPAAPGAAPVGGKDAPTAAGETPPAATAATPGDGERRERRRRGGEARAERNEAAAAGTSTQGAVR